jgi:multicomponent Na+:H+ antiporter subunit G
MSALADTLTLVLALAGTAFIAAGTVGLLRLPDPFSRLHALTKADNLGVGLIVLGLGIQSPSVIVAAKLVLIWLLVLAAGAAGAHLIASRELRKESDS